MPRRDPDTLESDDSWVGGFRVQFHASIRCWKRTGQDPDDPEAVLSTLNLLSAVAVASVVEPFDVDDSAEGARDRFSALLCGILPSSSLAAFLSTLFCIDHACAMNAWYIVLKLYCRSCARPEGSSSAKNHAGRSANVVR